MTDSTRKLEDAASALDLMVLKASYLDEMIGLRPWRLFSFQVEERSKEVHEHLRNYW